MDAEGRAQRASGQRWWQDWRWIAAVASVLAAASITTVAVTSILTKSEVQDITPLIERLDDVAANNRETLLEIQKNQEGIDTLVAFVEEVRANDDGGQSEAVTLIIELLCESSDPVRVTACAELGGP